MLNFNGTAQNVTKSNPFRQRSHGGGNCSDDGGAHEGEPALHPTRNNTNDPQKKHRLGTVSKNILLVGLNRFNGEPTSLLFQMWIKTHRCLVCMKDP